VPVFVVSSSVPQEWVYEGSPFTFVTDGLESTLEQAKAVAGDKDVAQVQAHVTAKDLELLSELMVIGKVRPQIDRRYAFAELPAAIAYLEQGRARGKVVAAFT